jgi:hypothetical protein
MYEFFNIILIDMPGKKFNINCLVLPGFYLLDRAGYSGYFILNRLLNNNKPRIPACQINPGAISWKKH